MRKGIELQKWVCVRCGMSLKIFRGLEIHQRQWCRKDKEEGKIEEEEKHRQEVKENIENEENLETESERKIKK